MKSHGSRLAAAGIVVAMILAGLAAWYFTHRTHRIEGVRHVVLISIDTCRADHLSCYGFKRETTPHIDAVAREGVLFEQALSPVPLTTPAHSSMLTGTYPPTHGVRLNNGESLAASNVTLAEVLKDAGYQTAAFVGGYPMDAAFGLNQGFETYDSRFTRSSEKSSTHLERIAEEVSRPAMAWLDQHSGDRFFLFLHFYDAHLDYEPPPPFASTYADDRYAGEIAYVDNWIGQIVDRLRALGVYDDTLLIITADHGESLGDHGERAHGFFIYESTVHVPLIIRAPHGPKGNRFEGRVSLVDLMPTVLDLAGLQTPERVQGTSLRRGMEEGRTQGGPRPLYCESLEATQFQCSGLHGIVDGPWKYIRAPRQELYDLPRDSGETNNVFEKEPKRAQRLRTRLEEMLAEMEAAAPYRDPASIDPAAVARLQSLGYVGGGATPANSVFDPELEDPKDFMQTFERLGNANAMARANRGEEAEKEFLEIVAGRPWLIAAHEQLAQIARHDKRPAAAVRHYQEIVTILTEAGNSGKPSAPGGRDLATAHFNLAFALREDGKDAEAIGHYEDALRLRPDYVDAHNSLGLALARDGKFKEAIAHYEEALGIEPDQAQVHNNLGNALRQTGRLAEALRHYEEALRIKPESVSALTNLALIRATNSDARFRNGEEAVRLAERACALTGRENIGCLDTLAAAYAEAERFDEAAGTAEQAAALARSSKQDTLADEILMRVALYRDGHPYRAVTNPPAP